MLVLVIFGIGTVLGAKIGIGTIWPVYSNHKKSEA
jgi:hypothetical protein